MTKFRVGVLVACAVGAGTVAFLSAASAHEGESHEEHGVPVTSIAPEFKPPSEGAFEVLDAKGNVKLDENGSPVTVVISNAPPAESIEQIERAQAAERAAEPEGKREVTKEGVEILHHAPEDMTIKP